LIVRNEAQFLAGCLASAKEVASEVILVDTGSTDETRAIAKQGGAVVIDFVWCDDFGKARNAGLAAANGDWVLVLDADERLTTETASKIKAFVEDSAADCGLFGLHDAAALDASEEEVVSGRARLGERLLVPRLFRNVDGLCFQGAIHEDTSAWLARRGMRVGTVGADIVHFGRVPVIAAARGKSARNVELLKRWCDSETLDFAPLGYLACELLEKGDQAGARRASDEGFRRLLAGKAPGHRAAIRLAVARCAIQLDAGDARGVLSTLCAAEAIDGAHPDYGYLRGRACEMLAFAAEAVARKRWLGQAADSYRGALDLGAIEYAQRYVPGSSSWASRIRLGSVSLMTGNAPLALDCFDEALKQPKAQREANLGHAEALIALGRPGEALAAIESMLDEAPDAWLLGAIAAESVGALADAISMLEAATQRARHPYIAAHRKDLHRNALCRFSIYGALPEVFVGPAGVIVAIAAGLPFAAGAELPSATALQWVGIVVRNLVQIGATTLVEPFFSARAEAAIPGSKAAALRALADLDIQVTDDGSPELVIVGASRAEDAELLGVVLGAHPRFRVERAIGVSPSERFAETLLATGDSNTRPLVISDDAFLNACTWAHTFPRARLVLLGRKGDDVTLEHDVAVRTTAMVRQSFLQSPVESIASLLAFLGEPPHAGPLRSLVANFPGAEPST